MTLMTTRLALVAALFAFLAAVSGAQAQDFTTLMAQATATARTYVAQVEAAQTAPDLATLQARTRTALATGDALISLLEAAEAAAPDDAGRSRARGLLDHVEAAQASGRDALSATSFEAARAALDAMRGEAVEALSELLPFEAAPPALPRAGGVDPLAALLAGLALLAGGLIARGPSRLAAA